MTGPFLRVLGVVALAASIGVAYAEPPDPAEAPGTALRRPAIGDPRTAGGESDLVHVVPTFSLASSTRNLTFGARLTVGRALGPGFSATLGGDWLLSGLVAGFLLDDIGSPRFTAAQLFTWTFAWPHLGDPPPGLRRWLPRLSLGVGAWETTEVDSLLQAFRTQDYGLYAAENLGGQVALVFPYVSVAFGLKPFGATQYLHEGRTFPTNLQFTNAILDVDVTFDLAQLWHAGRPGSP